MSYSLGVSDETPTVRPSGTVAVFERTLVEALDRLDNLPPSEESVDLRREIVALQAVFRAWTVRTPSREERTAAISRLMDVHRASEEIASKR